MLNILNMFSGEPWFSDVKRFFCFSIMKTMILSIIKK